jgi:transposase-like protein
MKTFKSIIEFQKHFSSEDKCRQFLELQKWGGTPCCTVCASTNVTRFKNDVRRFQCNEKGCRKQFSVLQGTFAENTKIPLSKWFLAMYVIANHSKGISSLQLASWLNVTQRTSWFLNHRIREMLNETGKGDLLSGTVEIDETYIGGKESNKHKHKKNPKKGVSGKAMVIGAIQRGGKLKTKVMPHTDIENIQHFIANTVEPNSNMVTDESHAYNRVHLNYKHETVNHGAKEYVRKDNKQVHTNNIEGYWNILKKQIVGIHHFVTAKHLQRYCNENAYRFNNRALAQDERFADALANCNGRLKYQDLIAK